MDSPKIVKLNPRERSTTVEHLYRQHWREICARLRKVFGAGPPDPEDLAQEAFAKFTRLIDYQSVEHPKAFIFRIALNLGYNSVRRISIARRHIAQSLQGVGQPLIDELSAEDVYSARERLAFLIDATDALSEKERVVLARSRIHGETYSEIRAATGWSEADISRRLHSALSTIQSKLRAAEEG